MQHFVTVGQASKAAGGGMREGEMGMAHIGSYPLCWQPHSPLSCTGDASYSAGLRRPIQMWVMEGNGDPFSFKASCSILQWIHHAPFCTSTRGEGYWALKIIQIKNIQDTNMPGHISIYSISIIPSISEYSVSYSRLPQQAWLTCFSR